MEPDRSRREFGTPQRASDLLGSVLKSVQTKSSRAEFVRVLRQSLTPAEAEDCRVVNFRGGTLWIEVRSAPLFAELSSFRRESLRAEMNERLAQQKVAKIVFRVDGTGHA